MRNFLKSKRIDLVERIIRLVDETLIVGYLLFRKFRQRGVIEKGLPVYLIVKKDHLLLSFLAILSISEFVKDLKFNIWVDGKLNLFDKLLIRKVGLPVNVISNKDLAKLQIQMGRFKWIKEFFKSSWQGKKFLLPILAKNNEKVLVLDSDVLFFNDPKQLRKWIVSGNRSFAIKDCGNFTIVSGIEAEYLLKTKISLRKVNTGLIGIDQKYFWKGNNLKKIDGLLKNIVNIVNDRKLKSNETNDPFGFAEHLLEQTMYWLAFSPRGVELFDKNYFVFGNHAINHDKLAKDLTSVHYAGGLHTKKALYRYLLFSFVQKFFDQSFGLLKNDKPWFIYSDNYCPRCWHDVKLRA